MLKDDTAEMKTLESIKKSSIILSRMPFHRWKEINHGFGWYTQGNRIHRLLHVKKIELNCHYLSREEKDGRDELKAIGSTEKDLEAFFLKDNFLERSSSKFNLALFLAVVAVGSNHISISLQIIFRNNASVILQFQTLNPCSSQLNPTLD